MINHPNRSKVASTKYRIVMENAGGELDSRTVTVRDNAADRETIVRDALIKLLEGCAYLNGGDVFRIEELEG